MCQVMDKALEYNSEHDFVQVHGTFGLTVHALLVQLHSVTWLCVHASNKAIHNRGCHS